MEKNIFDKSTKNNIEYNKNNIIEYKKKNDNVNDYIVNYSCYCSKFFYANDKILYILPCCHMVHEKCFNNYIIKYQYKNFDYNNNLNFSLNCPLCNQKIKTVLSEYKINLKKKKYNQYRIDIKSIRIDTSANINYMTLPLGIVKLTAFLNKLIAANDHKDIISTIENAFISLNLKINIIDNTKKNPIYIKNNIVNWKNKEDNNQKMVIISNHVSYMDSLILHYLFRSGFVSSDFINQTDLGKIISKKLKLLIFKRGVDTNMVEKIKEYLEEFKKIVIYPEGAFSNNETIIRFRTGAFHVGATIVPVVIKYNKVIYDEDFKLMLFKLITQEEIIVNVYINDFFYPPFDNDKIEKVREHMINVGNMEKSRVSNKNIRE